jgi:2C-methyl-D-erythritol 2,4-cyclodiphosphate synthase
MNVALILTTVNAPHSQKLDVHALADCLLHADAALAAPGHMSSFFGDVKPDLQIAFAHLVNVSQEQLVASAKAFANYSGESYALAA